MGLRKACIACRLGRNCEGSFITPLLLRSAANLWGSLCRRPLPTLLQLVGQRNSSAQCHKSRQVQNSGNACPSEVSTSAPCCENMMWDACSRCWVCTSCGMPLSSLSTTSLPSAVLSNESHVCGTRMTSLHRVFCMHHIETLCIVAKALVATESGCRRPVSFACALSLPLGVATSATQRN